MMIFGGDLRGVCGGRMNSVNVLSCPFCGADIIVCGEIKKVYCPDKECSGRYGLLVKIDPEGIGYLAEAFFQELRGGMEKLNE
jgi:hypothetical protein